MGFGLGASINVLDVSANVNEEKLFGCSWICSCFGLSHTHPSGGFVDWVGSCRFKLVTISRGQVMDLGFSIVGVGVYLYIHVKCRWISLFASTRHHSENDKVLAR